MAKELLEEIIPKLCGPTLLGSDNGPAFISQVTQSLVKIMGTDWKLHCAYCPQSSGQVELINQTLKELLTKLTPETGNDWVALLPHALYKTRNTPYTQGLTPFKIVCGRPHTLMPNLATPIALNYMMKSGLRGITTRHLSLVGKALTH